MYWLHVQDVPVVPVPVLPVETDVRLSFKK